MILVFVACQYQNGFLRVQNRQSALKIIEKIIAASGFGQKTAVVNIGYFHE